MDSKRVIQYRHTLVANVWQRYIRQYNTLPKYQPTLKHLYEYAYFESYFNYYDRTKFMIYSDSLIFMFYPRKWVFRNRIYPKVEAKQEFFKYDYLFI